MLLRVAFRGGRMAKSRFRSHAGLGFRACCLTLSVLTCCSVAMVRPTPEVNSVTRTQECADVAYAAFDAAGAGLAAGTALLIPALVAFHNAGTALCDPYPGQTCPATSVQDPFRLDSCWCCGCVGCISDLRLPGDQPLS